MDDDKSTTPVEMQNAVLRAALAGLVALTTASARKGSIDIDSFEGLLDALKASDHASGDAGDALQVRADVFDLLKLAARDGATKNE